MVQHFLNAVALAALLAPTLTAAFGGEADYYRIDGDECSQCELGYTLGFCPITIVLSQGGLSKGRCDAQGFNVDAGTCILVFLTHFVACKVNSRILPGMSIALVGALVTPGSVLPAVTLYRFMLMSTCVYECLEATGSFVLSFIHADVSMPIQMPRSNRLLRSSPCPHQFPSDNPFIYADVNMDFFSMKLPDEGKSDQAAGPCGTIHFTLFKRTAGRQMVRAAPSSLVGIGDGNKQVHIQKMKEGPLSSPPPSWIQTPVQSSVLHLSSAKRDLGGAATASGIIVFGGGCVGGSSVFTCEEPSGNIDLFQNGAPVASSSVLTYARGWPATCAAGEKVAFLGGGTSGSRAHKPVLDVLDLSNLQEPTVRGTCVSR